MVLWQSAQMSREIWGSEESSRPFMDFSLPLRFCELCVLLKFFFQKKQHRVWLSENSGVNYALTGDLRGEHFSSAETLRPKRSETHKSHLLSPIDYPKGFVCFCHIIDLETSCMGDSGQCVDGVLEAKQTRGMGEARSTAWTSFFPLVNSNRFVKCLLCVRCCGGVEMAYIVQM